MAQVCNISIDPTERFEATESFGLPRTQSYVEESITLPSAQNKNSLVEDNIGKETSGMSRNQGLTKAQTQYMPINFSNNSLAVVKNSSLKRKASPRSQTSTKKEVSFIPGDVDDV